MKVTVENFEEQFAISLARLLAAIDLEKTDKQKAEAHGHYRSVEMNHRFYQGAVARGEHVYVCATCGAIASATYVEPIKTQMLAANDCFHCNFWKERSKEVAPNRLVIEGHIYTDGGNSPGVRTDFLGFGGHKWIIERDGKVWETNNLWSGSTVPEAYIQHFPDNAKFLKALP